MKRMLILVFALVALTALTGLGIAQPQGERGEKQQITGQVTKVDRAAKTFTVQGKGVEATLPATGPLPSVGSKIKITIECRRRKCTITIEI